MSQGQYDLRGLNSKGLSREEIVGKLKEMLDDERFTHSMAVSELAVKLSKRYGYDPAKAELAGLVHDCAKCMSPALLIKKVYEYGIELDEIERRYPALWHPIVSAYVARDEFGVEDEEILSAVRLHTTGDGEMGLLDKIIYVADYADPTREYPESEKVRRLAFKNLDRALLETTKQKIIYVLGKGKVMIHPRTVAAHNSAVEAVTSEL
jgi:predicted HD superfamily hydrolase involved in NAD metabolism